MVTPSSSFWRGRRVLLTGHTGFKGSWLVLWLQSLGAEISGLALEPPTDPSLYGLACDLGERDHRVDIRDPAGVAAVVEAVRPEVVIHMAAQSLVRPSYEDPVGTYATNVMGLVHLLDAVRRVSGVRVMVNVTSDKCYENREWLWAYREDEPMGGHDPYSNSKGCAELVTSAWRRSFLADGKATALASARAGNVIGGGDWARDRIVPDCVRAFSAGQKVELRNPQAIRPWQHVLEPLCGYLLLAQRLWADGAAFAEGWNFGPHDTDTRSVAQLVQTLADVWGDGAAWHAADTPQPHEANYLKIDASKARARLDWQPRLTVEQTLAWTADWYRRQANGASARQLCLEQVQQYQAQDHIA